LLIVASLTVVCPNCRHIGTVRAASLPRILSCSVCGDRRLVREGFKIRNRDAMTTRKPLEVEVGD
jgi:DNA-directed RNA polymerase subunit RPC12/RpoP